MEIQNRPIEEIKPYPNNSKQHPKGQVTKIANSIKAFGFNQPIVVDKEGTIIVGHGRYEAAQVLKMTEVPVLEVDISEEAAKAYRLADNKLNESKWEMDMAIEELKTLSLEMVDLTGFDRDLILETKEDEPLDLSGVGKPISEEGDVYELGRHKLICGDSTNEDTYKKLLKEERARLIYTDPPYGVDYTSEGHGENKGRIKGDGKSEEGSSNLFKKALQELKKFSTDDATLYWWFASSMTDVNMKAWRDTGWHFSQIAIWLKNSMVYSPGQNFHRVYEPCMIGWKEGQARYINRTFTNLTELWTVNKKEFKDHLDVWYQKRDKVQDYIHPTQKPVQLAERALKRSSEENDIVLDAFAGSGSTMIACEQLNRRARLIEWDPKYADAIVSRWVKYSKDPKIIKNGKEINWTA